MTEVPGSEWSHDFDVAQALRSAPRLRGAKWRRLAGVGAAMCSRIFRSSLRCSPRRSLAATPAPKGARWVKIADLPGEALPNVMRKVLAHALDREPGHGR